MSSAWAFRRKLIINSIIFIVFVIIFVLFVLWWRYEPPTCQDGLQNQDELGVDCGGICGSICPFESVSPTVLWTRVFHSNDTYQIVSYIRNTNTDLTARDAKYDIALFDRNNVKINPLSGTVTLLPSSITPVFISMRIEEGDDIPNRAFLEFTDGIEWSRSTVDEKETKLRIINERLVLDEETPRVEGEVENLSLNPIRNIDFFATVFDEEGNAIAASRYFIKRIAQRERKDLIFQWRERIDGVESLCRLDTQVFAFLNLESSNVSLTSAFQNLLAEIRPRDSFAGVVRLGDRITKTDNFETDVSANSITSLFREVSGSEVYKEIGDTLSTRDPNKKLLIFVISESDFLQTSISGEQERLKTLFENINSEIYLITPDTSTTTEEELLGIRYRKIGTTKNDVSSSYRFSTSERCVSQPIRVEVIPIIEKI
ncbi:MAG: hypothetical protein OXU73_02905 [Candidatus Campbellbacteria bacterium]|nr:hypothetical protein [Candidatus Campbellbacteria bacterium]